MALRNLTPHDLNVVDIDGVEILKISPDGEVPRVAMNASTTTMEIGGVEIALHAVDMGALEGLPEREDEVHLVVSRLVYEAAGQRGDLLVPGPPKRDGEGKVVGCYGLSR